MIKSQLYCLTWIDYASLKKGNEIENRHNSFRKDIVIKFLPLENCVYLLRRAILEERIEKRKCNKPNPDYITSADGKVSAFLPNQLEILSGLLEEVGLYLKTIDDNCNKRYNWEDIREKTKNSYKPILFE